MRHFKKYSHWILLYLVILISPLIFLSYDLVDNPPGFFIDEAIYGYEAYSLATTGLSSNGEFFPQLFMPKGATGTIRDHGNYPYYIIPFILLFGNNEFAVRVTSLYFSIALLTMIYFLMRKRVSYTAFILGAVSWPFIGWVFLTARMGMEESAYACISMIVLFLLLKIREQKKIATKYVVLLALGISALFYIYAAGKLLALLYIPLALYVIRKKSTWEMLVLFLGIVGFGLSLSLPYILDGSFFYRGDDITKCFQDSCIIPNIASHFSFANYFGNTYIPHDFAVQTHSITGTPLIPVYFIPFLFIGLIYVVISAWKRDRFSQLLIITFFISIIPASLTIRGFDSYRSVGILPILFIIVLFGLDITLRFFKEKWRIAYKVIAIMIFSIFVVWGMQQYSIFLKYKYNVFAASYSGWQYGYRKVFDYIDEHYQEYDRFIVTKYIAYGPEIYIKYFDPEEQYKKIEIGSITQHSSPRTLFVIRPYELPKENFLVKKVIYYPNNCDAAYYIGELR